MAVAPRKWRDRETSPERTKVWVEPKPRSTHRRVPVVYYLSRNGQLEHPHFMEVPLSSSDGLYLKDVVNRLNVLRGKGMASIYAWSSKRSYKNGYVWHDLTDDDLILPAHGNEYVLKGSEVLFPEISPIVHEPHPAASSSFEKPLVPSREQRRTSWGGSLDLAEYKVYKSDVGTGNPNKAADAATQTDDRRIPRRRSPDFAPPRPEAELGSDDISPPPSSSSPETLETLINSEVKINGPRDSHVAPSDQLEESGSDQMVGSIASGRMRASAVLMQLISCGSIQVKDNSGGSSCQYSEKMKRGLSNVSSTKDLSRKEMDGMLGRVGFDPMDREYFSGSLVETKKKDGEECADGFGALKRSNSYNASDRSSKFDIVENEMDTSRTKCIPRKQRGAMKREASISNPSQISRSNLGSKRISDGAIS